MIELYTHPMSPCAQKVRIVLAEKSLEYQPRFVDLANKENLKPEYLALNHLGVVPTLVHNKHPIIESSIICEYLNDAFPQHNLSPDDPLERAEMRFWMKHIDTKLHPSCGALQWPIIMRPALLEKTETERKALLDRIPEKPRRERQKRLMEMGLEAPDVIDAVQVYRSTILRMEQALGLHRWIVSDHFSLADICLAPYFQTIYQFGWEKIYEDCPKVTDWFERCLNRDSYQKGVSSDFNKELLSQLKEQGQIAWEIIERHLQHK